MLYFFPYIWHRNKIDKGLTNPVKMKTLKPMRSKELQPKKKSGSDMIAASQICDVATSGKALSTFMIVDE